MAASCAYEICLQEIGYGSRVLARDIRLSVRPGECILLAGANGCGKTTLLKAIAAENCSAPEAVSLRELRSLCSLRPLPLSSSPSLRDNSFPTGPSPCPSPGVDTSLRGSSFRIAPRLSVLYLPTGIPKVKGFTVREFIRTGCYKESAWKREDRHSTACSWNLESSISQALETLCIADLDDRDISTLSDGQFQKAILAIALTRQADLLLLDEPTAFLDVPNRRAVLHTLRDLTRDRGLAVIFSSHDIADALEVADRVIGITPGGDFLTSGPDDREAVLDRLFDWR